jgi:hypothetical protein
VDRVVRKFIEKSVVPLRSHHESVERTPGLAGALSIGRFTGPCYRSSYRAIHDPFYPLPGHILLSYLANAASPYALPPWTTGAALGGHRGKLQGQIAAFPRVGGVGNGKGPVAGQAG